MAKKKKSSRKLELNVNIRRKRRTRAFLIFVGIFFVFSVLFGIVVGSCMIKEGTDNIIIGITSIPSVFDDGFSSLLDFRFGTETFIAVGIMLFVWGISSALLHHRA